MEELLTCSMNCRNKPIYVCDCSDKKVFICLNHALSHVITPGSHHYEPIMKKPDPQTKIIIFKFLKGLKLQIKENRFKIIQEALLLIKQIKEATTKSLEKLLNIEKRLDEYIYLWNTLDEVNNLNNKSFIELILKLSPEDTSNIKCRDETISINNANFKEKIENLFTIKETKDLFDVDNFGLFKLPIIKYF